MTLRTPRSSHDYLEAHNRLRAEITKLRNQEARSPEHQAKSLREQIANLEVDRKGLLEQWRSAEIDEQTAVRDAAQAELAKIEGEIKAAYAVVLADPTSRKPDVVRAHQALNVRDDLTLKIGSALARITQAREAS